MTPFDLYVLTLCLIVFTAFVSLFSVMIVMLVRYSLRLINLGAEDEKIKIEYEKALAKRSKRREHIIGCVTWAITLAVVIVAFVSFCVAVFIDARSNAVVGNTPSLKVVLSSSMSTKNPDNSYLFENDLDDQLQTFDLIVLHKLPQEEELKQYDIVAYERNGELILHRIVNIEEPNENHPEKRYFLLRGDAVGANDKFPVLYEDMRGVYKGESIPMLGSFFVFMRSPAGILCIILILFALVATPIAERKLKDAKDRRYALMCPATVPAESTDEEAFTPSEIIEIEEHLHHTDVFRLALSRKKDVQIFRSRIANASYTTKAYYVEIAEFFAGIDGVRINYSSTYQTFRTASSPIARIRVRSDAIGIYIAASPEKYQEYSGSFTDLSSQNSFVNFPMLVKINSPEKMELAKKLISEIISESKAKERECEYV